MGPFLLPFTQEHKKSPNCGTVLLPILFKKHMSGLAVVSAQGAGRPPAGGSWELSDSRTPRAPSSNQQWVVQCQLGTFSHLCSVSKQNFPNCWVTSEQH